MTCSLTTVTSTVLAVRLLLLMTIIVTVAREVFVATRRITILRNSHTFTVITLPEML